jgi:hypothetical protein
MLSVATMNKYILLSGSFTNRNNMFERGICKKYQLRDEKVLRV